MSKFTPGPWCVGHTLQGGSKTVPRFEAYVHAGEISNHGNCIAVVHMGDAGAIHNDRQSVEANARLIAAAPDLYDALSKFVEHFGDPFKTARAALAKADGGAQ